MRRVASSLDLRKKQCEEKWIRCVDAAPERTLLAIHASSQQFHPPRQLSHRFDFLFFCTSTQFRVQAHTRKAVSSVIRVTKPPIRSCNRTRPAEARPTPPSWPTMVDWLFTDTSMGFVHVNCTSERPSPPVPFPVGKWTVRIGTTLNSVLSAAGATTLPYDPIWLATSSSRYKFFTHRGVHLQHGRQIEPFWLHRPAVRRRILRSRDRPWRSRPGKCYPSSCQLTTPTNPVITLWSTYL